MRGGRLLSPWRGLCQTCCHVPSPLHQAPLPGLLCLPWGSHSCESLQPSLPHILQDKPTQEQENLWAFSDEIAFSWLNINVQKIRTMTTNLLKKHQRLPIPEESLVVTSWHEWDAGRGVPVLVRAAQTHLRSKSSLHQAADLGGRELGWGGLRKHSFLALLL